MAYVLHDRNARTTAPLRVHSWRWAAAIVLAGSTATGVMADAERGKTLADALCARCHMSEGQGEKQGPMGVPGFKAVANRPGQTLDAIVHWLRSVPPMMPDHHLTKDESEHLAEFILTLRNSK